MIWKLNTLPKAKNFMWCLLSKAFAVKKEHEENGMSVEKGCLICGSKKTRKHVITGCGWTEAVWFGVLRSGIGRELHH